MWLEALYMDTLIREQIAEAQREAALEHLLRRAEPSRDPIRWWAVIRHRAHAAMIPRLKRLIERVALP